MRAALLLLIGLVVTPCLSWGQNSQTAKSPVSDTVRTIVERSAKNMVGAAEEMPADKYAYHPTPAQMTFAHLVVHMANSNNFLCSKISGQAVPSAEKLADTDSKDKLVGALKASFDFCTQSLAKVDDSNLGEQLTLFGSRTTTRAGAMIALTNDFADHYSEAAMYLRLNDLLPPTAQKKE
jgi:uncharacterized damage-inducible protein DinB